MIHDSVMESKSSGMEAISRELGVSRQAQVDAEFARELAGQIVVKVASFVPYLPLAELQILDVYITKSLELAGMDNGKGE